MVNIPKRQLVHLQSVGNVPGTPASRLRIGDRVMWNFGYVSTVERITPSKSGNTLTVEFIGSKYSRRFSLNTLVPLATPSRHNDYWWNYDANVYSFDFQHSTSDTDDLKLKLQALYAQDNAAAWDMEALRRKRNQLHDQITLLENRIYLQSR